MVGWIEGMVGWFEGMKEQDTAMHGIVIDEFESHLNGRASESFYRHLEACADCRLEVESISSLSQSFAVFRPEGDLAPLPSELFFSKVSNRINEQQKRSIWNLFSMSELVVRRVAFASLMLLAGLGSYLVTQETSYTGVDAAAIMAQHIDMDKDWANEIPPSANAPVHRDYMLLQLVDYQQ